MSKKIFMDKWLLFKPYNNPTNTDLYYLKICNKVKAAILSENRTTILDEYLDELEVELLSCYLTSYLEDKISGSSIYNTFIKINKKLYNKTLPFYDLDDYYEDEINVQDVKFLIWFYMDLDNSREFILPMNPLISETAKNVISVLDDAWEYAPENLQLKSFYEIDGKENDYYAARLIIDNILFRTYLFYPDTICKLMDHELLIIDEHKNSNPDYAISLLNENRDQILQSNYTRLLSLKGKIWVAELLTEQHQLSQHYRDISQKISGYFFYKGQDQNDLTIEHIASSKVFKITKKSFEFSHELTVIDTIVFMGIVKWKNEWWFSGMYFSQRFNADIVLDEKNSIQSRSSVSFLDHEQNNFDKLLKLQSDAFLDYNDGSHIAFMPGSEIESFVKGFMDYYNKSLNKSEEAEIATYDRAKKDGLLKNFAGDIPFKESTESGLVFFNPSRGVEMLIFHNEAFKHPNNPYQTLENNNSSIADILTSPEISKELAQFCLFECENNLTFLKYGLGPNYLEDLDFLFRHWKSQVYHSNISAAYL